MTDTMGLMGSHKLLRVLLDSGSSKTLVKRSTLPKVVHSKELAVVKSFKTLAGKLLTQSGITTQDVQLPEFDKNRQLVKKRHSFLTMIIANMISSLALTFSPRLE